MVYSYKIKFKTKRPLTRTELSNITTRMNSKKIPRGTEFKIDVTKLKK